MISVVAGFTISVVGYIPYFLLDHVFEFLMPIFPTPVLVIINILSGPLVSVLIGASVGWVSNRFFQAGQSRDVRICAKAGGIAGIIGTVIMLAETLLNYAS